MKRVIKFRVFDKNIPRNEGELNNPTGDMIEWEYVKQSSYLIDGINGKYPLMQFTGLHDKNGKEIYEGDIIKKANGVCGVIVWNAPFFEVTVSENQSSLYTKEWICDSIIIGNIHENPELLNQ